jgi:ATP-dependent DNA helicase DinG
MLRFTSQAAALLRRAIRESDGTEVFAIGDVEDGVVTGLTVTCRGQEDRVIALIDRPRPGQVVIHNHPSGELRPSNADMDLAGRYGQDGVGFVITNSDVTESRWVVEPHKPVMHPVDPTAIERFFLEDLPRVLPDFEARPGQIEMALAVGRALTDERPFVVEAGTGTGKSLAYLVPAALWALANSQKVVISTHTKALQGQLLASDLPMLTKAGLNATYAVLQGRNNYACKRRLTAAVAEDAELPSSERVLDAIAAWEKTSQDGSRGDISFPVDANVWERVESDSDLTLSTRCPHYAECRFYVARRQAAAAHLVVVNHALLLADLAIKSESPTAGVLPKYKRLILDEAHHLEDAATGASTERLTERGVTRAVGPLLAFRKRRGALDRLWAAHLGLKSPLSADKKALLDRAIPLAQDHASSLREHVPATLEIIAGDALPGDGSAIRITPEEEATERWNDLVAPRVVELANQLEDAAGALDAVLSVYEDVKLAQADVEPLMDVRRAARRLAEHAAIARGFLTEAESSCRWLDGVRGRFGPTRAALNRAPIEVGPTLRTLLWSPFPGTVATSATMTVANRFTYWSSRVGLVEDDGAETLTVPSPFDHAVQALLALPRDVPEPDADGFLAETCRMVIDAVRLSDGGAFVLCTSYRAVEAYGKALRNALPAEQPVLMQGQGGRLGLLDRFRENRRSVLVGTDSFWEGVSVKGEALRMVIIPRLPFRVPTEPLRLSRHERIAARGGDPFRAFSLPEAVIKLRQGYGRLIRHKADRGVVLLLDRRVHDRSYGALMLQSLPPARRVNAPWARVREEIAKFYRENG